MRFNKSTVRLFTIGMALASLPFLYQNCANTSGCVDPENPMCGSAPPPAGSATQASNGNSDSSTTTGTSVGFGSGNSSGSSGSGTVSTGGTTSGAGAGNFVLSKNLSNLNISDTGDGLGQGTLEVTVSGGQGIPTFVWHREVSSGGTLRDEVVKDNSYFSSSGSTLYISSRDFSVEGSYYVVVTDGAGTKIVSNKVAVKVMEPYIGCQSGTYWSSKVDPFNSAQGLQSRFVNSRGSFLLHARYLMGVPLSLQVGAGQFGSASIQAGSAGALKTIACTNFLPPIHAPTNPYGGTWTGAITVKCQNDKWQLISNTCQQQVPDNFADLYGG